MEDQMRPGVPLLEAFLVIIVTFFLSIFVGVIILFAIGEEVTLVFGELLILIIPLCYLLYKHVNIKDFIRINLSPKYIGLGLVCGVALIPLNILIVTALTAIFGNSAAVEQANSLYANLSSSTSGLVAVVLSMTMAGICEEFAFRGFLQTSILKNLMKKANYARYSYVIAILASATVFGIFHFDPQIVYILATFLAGLVLGYIYHRWGYVASATAHASMNLIVLALLLMGT